jgi:phage recombination protein Bet
MSSLVKVEMYPLNSVLEEKKALIKATVCKGASDAELELFLHVCKRVGLDPLMRQIYSIQRGNQRTIQTGIDGFRLIAERTGNYSPGREPTFVMKEDGSILSCTAYVLKRTDSKEWHEISATAYFDEYAVKSNPIWKDKPHCMISKCAECLAIRKAFPSNLAGLYGDDEMERAKAPTQPEQDITAEVIEDVKMLAPDELINFSASVVDTLNGLNDYKFFIPYAPFAEFLKAVDYRMVHEKKRSLKSAVDVWMKDPVKLVDTFVNWRNQQDEAKRVDLKSA